MRHEPEDPAQAEERLERHILRLLERLVAEPVPPHLRDLALRLEEALRARRGR